MSLRMLRNAGLNVPLVGLVSSVALLSSLESAEAVTVLEMRRVVSAPGRPSDADTKLITSYLGSDFFRYFMNPPDGNTLPGLRKDFGSIVRGVGKTPGHDLLNQYAFRYATTVIRDSRFSPAAKYNAMLLIADLNESDIANAIKPYPPALEMLTKCLSIPPESDMAYLKPAALIGITRLAEMNAMPPGAVPTISKALVAILSDEDPPAGRSGSAHNYMRRSAARALAALDTPGLSTEVVAAMRKIVADPNARITLRCEMAQLLGELNIPPEAKVDYKDLANLIGHQTVEICEQELARAEEEKREPSRRILMYALKSGDLGLDGLSDSAAQDAKATKFIKGIRSKVSSLHSTLDDVNKTPDNKIVDTVSPEIETIESMLLAKPAATAPLVAAGTKEPATPPGTTN